jgi:DNA mismatch repair protein MutS
MADKAPDTSGMTPMMAQFFEIKAVNPNCLLFYRMGDFYELFFEDAEIASRALGITLTKRGKHQGDDIPMCGVPVHAAQDYLKKLIALGHRVAVCEQTEDPAEAKKRGSKSVVKRDVVRLVTAGTLTEDDLLPADTNNYLVSIALLPHGDNDLALAWADISTGEIGCAEIPEAALSDEIARIGPAEIILTDASLQALDKALPHPDSCQIITQSRDLFDTENATDRITAAYPADVLDPTSLTRVARSALGALIGYVADTQKGASIPLRPPQLGVQKTLIIDAATRASLELIATNRGEARGSLRHCLDRCVTAPGSRLLSARLSAPSADPAEIEARLDMVAGLFADTMVTDGLRDRLKSVPDMARALTRLSLERGGPRDLRAIGGALSGAEALADELASVSATADGLARLAAALADVPHDLMAEIDKALAEDLPLLTRDGGFIAKGYDADLDEQRSLSQESRSVIAALQAKYAELAEVKSLKVKHNNVLGYFVEVPASHGPRLLAEPLNATFIHRQTTANALRFTTTELADLETRIAHSSAAALEIELAIFAKLRQAVLDETPRLQAIADALAETDLTANLAHIAQTRNYCRPKIDESLAFDIDEGRHPVVEQMLEAAGETRFVANDCDLGGEAGGALWLLTGPNMGGKSTFLRQNALIAVMAQMGGFVPANAAHIGVIDRIFSRVGAADDIAHGRSTFMVEMIETAAILNRATRHSLVVLDEIGRGTATFDGLSIAWAAVEALHEQTGCRALFATHYHELTALADRLDRVSNHTMTVREYKGDVIFLHAVAPGAADRSYGIQVARLAGLPPEVVARAREVLEHLESRSNGADNNGTGDLPLFARRPRREETQNIDDPLSERMDSVDPDALTPGQAIDLIYELKRLRNARRNR